MNIFILDNNPMIAAQYHCNKHVLKMIVESAQLLSTAHHIHSLNPNPQLYKQTHTNHPCAKWVRENNQNYQWTFQLFVELLKEYTFRYGKVHACSKLLSILDKTPDNIQYSDSISAFVQCMPDEYKHIDPVKGYRNYYRNDKVRFAKWTKRNIPDWFRTQ